MNRNSPHPSRLALRIRYLRPSPRALAACEALGVDTVGEFCQRSKEEFLAQPNFGARTWSDLSRRVEQFLDETGAVPELSGEGLERPVAEVIRNRRALRACRALHIRTVGEFLATPPEELLAVPGFGERTLWETHRDLIGTSPAEATAEIMPRCLLDLPVGALPDLARRRIHAPDGTRIEDLVSGLAPPETRAALKQGLEELVSDLLASRSENFVDWLRDARARMRRPARLACDRVLGIGRRPQPLHQAAAALRVTVEEVGDLLTEAKAILLQQDPPAIERWAHEVKASLKALDGVVTPSTLAAGSALRAATRATRDAALSLRVLSFCRPDIGYTHGDFTCRLDPDAIARLVEAMRSQLAESSGALSLAAIRGTLPADILPPGNDGLVEHLLRHRLHRTLSFDGKNGEVLLRTTRGVADRVEAILEAEQKPMRIDDVLFHYRDRYRRGRRVRPGYEPQSGNGARDQDALRNSGGVHDPGSTGQAGRDSIMGGRIPWVGLMLGARCAHSVVRGLRRIEPTRYPGLRE